MKLRDNSILGLINKYSKDPKDVINEESGAFSVIIDDIDRASRLVAYAESKGLTVDPSEFYPNEGLSSISFFFDNNRYDVNYVHTATENIIRDLVPRFSAKKDYYKVRSLILNRAKYKEVLRKDLGYKKGVTLRHLVTEKEVIKTLKDLEAVNRLRKCAEAERCVCNSAEASSYIEVQEHFVQVGTKIIPKDPNDFVILR